MAQSLVRSRRRHQHWPLLHLPLQPQLQLQILTVGTTLLRAVEVHQVLLLEVLQALQALQVLLQVVLPAVVLLDPQVPQEVVVSQL